MVAANLENVRRRTIATLLGAGGVLLWASEPSLVTFAGDVPPLEIIALAFGAIGLLSPLVWWANGISAAAALRQPIGAWLLTVVSLLAFHTCMYHAVQNAPPAGAALLQGFTPLLIVVGSALLPGERLRWWHVAGTVAGLIGTMFLVVQAEGHPVSGRSAVVPLAAAGVAAASWAIYSVLNRRYTEVPSAAIGGFYAASAVLAAVGQVLFETWVAPSPAGWLAILALGLFPMGLSLYLWDYAVKNGDLQALGAFSYSEPLLAALIVILLGGDEPSWSLLWAGVLILGGAVLAARSMWEPVLQAGADQGSDRPFRRGLRAGAAPSALSTDAVLRDFQSAVANNLSELETAFSTALGAAQPDAAGSAAIMREHWPVLFASEVGDFDRWRLERLARSHPGLVLNEEAIRRSYRAVLDCLLQLALKRCRWRRRRLALLVSVISERLVEDLVFLRSVRSSPTARMAEGIALDPRHPLVRLDAQVREAAAARTVLEGRVEALCASADGLASLTAGLAMQAELTARRDAARMGEQGRTTQGGQADTIVQLLEAVAGTSGRLAQAAASELVRIRQSDDHVAALAGEVTELARRTSAALDAIAPRSGPARPRRPKSAPPAAAVDLSSDGAVRISA